MKHDYQMKRKIELLRIFSVAILRLL